MVLGWYYDGTRVVLWQCYGSTRSTQISDARDAANEAIRLEKENWELVRNQVRTALAPPQYHSSTTLVLVLPWYCPSTTLVPPSYHSSTTLQ